MILYTAKYIYIHLMACAGQHDQVLYVRVSTIPLLIYTLLQIVTVHIYMWLTMTS